MRSASIPLPLAFLLTDELHDMDVRHFDGWQKTIVPGWHIRRCGPTYRLQHGKVSIGEIEDVKVGGRDRPESFQVVLVSGLTVCFPIRQPRKVAE